MKATFGARTRAGSSGRNECSGASAVLGVVLSLLLCGESCTAFLQPIVTGPSAPGSSATAATGGGRRSFSSSVTTVQRREGGRVQQLSPVLGGRSCWPLAASDNNGAGAAGPSGGSADIFEALMAGDMAFVTDYVQSGGDCSLQDAIGDTPLMLAVESELTSAVRLLITEGGADVNRASETTGETPLMLASYYGHTNLARVLVVEGGAELEARNNKGDTALSLACFWGNEDAVQYLLEAGADPNTRNDGGERPGDRFDDVFVPSVVGNFFTADEEADSDGEAKKMKEDGEEKDIMFDDEDDDDEEDIMFDDVKTGTDSDEGAEKEEGVKLDEKEDGEDEEGEDGNGTEGEEEEELQGPREVIRDMLERARARV